MKRDINSLIGFKIAATDGELGTVKDFYFDDHSWTIRYLIVETGTWLNSRKVFVSPQSVQSGFRDPGKFHVNLTMDQLKNSPSIDTDLPVSRQQEEILHMHHSWQNYWDNNFFGGGTSGDTIPAEEINGENETPGKEYNTHLRSAADVSGYQIHASNGIIGHVNNFLIDDDTWQLLNFVVDTTKWFGGKKVLVDVNYVEAVQWYNYIVFVNIDMAHVENSPEYHRPQ
ncbi:MAG: PRC-barrel domain-containing protein [Mucilaginibacter sp.]|uniref:PRC-barrel domain containing protein n=1 Tax=Mucilaginibacter sp. TaxID=1882438 RepID=UPI003265E85B